MRDRTSKYVALAGGWGSGKTWAGAQKLIDYHLFNAFANVNGLVVPTYVPSAVVAPIYSNAMDFDVPALCDTLDERGLSYRWIGSGTGGAGGRFSGPAIIITDLGTRSHPSVIIIRTADSPQRITGWEVGAAWGDEPARWPESPFNPKLDPLLQLKGRVRHPKAHKHILIFTYTNEGDHTAIYEEFHSGKPDHAIYHAKTKDNPIVREFYEDMKGQLTETMARQYLEGEAISLRGENVYGVFSSDTNVDDSIVLREDLPLQLSLDFNISPGMHAEIGQYDQTADVFTCVHEIYRDSLDLRQLIVEFEHFVGQLGGWRWPILHIFGDATGTGRWAGTGETCYTILRESMDRLNIPYRIRVPKSNPPVVDRVNAVNIAFKDMAGQVHYKIHSRCKRLIEDFNKVRYDERGEIDKKKVLLSHASDAEGYRISYLRPARALTVHAGGRWAFQKG